MKSINYLKKIVDIVDETPVEYKSIIIKDNEDQEYMDLVITARILDWDKLDSLYDYLKNSWEGNINIKLTPKEKNE